MLLFCLRFVLAVSLAFYAPTLAHADSNGQGSYGGGRGGGGYGGGNGEGGDGGGGISIFVSNLVARTLRRGVVRCQSVEDVYRYDCYRQVYRLAAKQLNGRPAYAEARAVLIEVEKKLERIVTRNVDPHAPPVRKGVQQFRAIRPASLPKARAQFIQALDEAETQLLRSSGGGGTQYARIAEAINSNKVLLRS